jgi:hypothetical protein
MYICSTNDRVNPLYYVTFTTATLCASFILFKGFNTTNAVNTLSLLCGFLIIFSGVYLLNFSRSNPNGFASIEDAVLREEFPLENGVAAGMQARRSLQSRGSVSNFQPRRNSSFPKREATLQAAIDDEESLGLTQLDDLDVAQPKIAD